MLKGLYDLDCTTWSPQGKLFQVEYAMEAVKQGSICLGLRSNDFVVLCSLTKLPSELACYQDKIFKVEDNIGMAISGLTADARVLCKYMRNESLNYKLTYGSNQPLNRLIFKIADSNPTHMQSPKSRPSTPPKDPMVLACSLPALTRMVLISSKPGPVTFLSVPSYHTLVHRVRFHCSINSPEKTSLYMIKTACDSLMVIDPLLLDELCKAFGNTYILAERQQS